MLARWGGNEKDQSCRMIRHPSGVCCFSVLFGVLHGEYMHMGDDDRYWMQDEKGF